MPFLCLFLLFCDKNILSLELLDAAARQMYLKSKGCMLAIPETRKQSE